MYAFMNACVYMCSGSLAGRNTRRIKQELWSPRTDVGGGDWGGGSRNGSETSLRKPFSIVLILNHGSGFYSGK